MTYSSQFDTSLVSTSSFPEELSSAPRESIWSSVSTWCLVCLVIWISLGGVSPFATEDVKFRAVQSSPAGGMVDRLIKALTFGACMFYVSRMPAAIKGLTQQIKLLIAFPILAILLFPVSQQITRTISSGAVLLGGTLLVFYMLARFSMEEVLEFLLVLGAISLFISIVFAILLPQYGIDTVGGHYPAWKGIYSAKNRFGNMVVLFMTVALTYRPRTRWLRFVTWSMILVCPVALYFSFAATSYVMLALYITYKVVFWILRPARKRDYVIACCLALLGFVVLSTLLITESSALFALLGKDPTLTGRTEIWSAVLDSIAKRPLLGYGYQAFWLGFQGESYQIILAVTWALAQAQNGFLDITLQTGVVGLGVVLLLFLFAFRDAFFCLFTSSDRDQLRYAEWCLAIVGLTVIYNLDESFLFEPGHLGSTVFLIAIIALRIERNQLRATQASTPELAPQPEQVAFA